MKEKKKLKIKIVICSLPAIAYGILTIVSDHPWIGTISGTGHYAPRSVAIPYGAFWVALGVAMLVAGLLIHED